MRRPAAAILALLLFGPVAASPARAADVPPWWRVESPSPAPAQAIGSPARGCLAGGVALPADGPAFEVMRLSRHRFYGLPRLIHFIETLAEKARALGWPGILVGDLAQPRGGPMHSGHRSHQTGLDVDIWFEPAPKQRLTTEERETLAAPSVVASDGRSLDFPLWTPAHAGLLRAAAESPDVDRIFVNPAIKAHLCATTGPDRTWLRKIRPWWGHDDHFHVRLTCPQADTACLSQDPVPPGDGCDASLEWWFSEEAAAELHKPKPPPKPLTLDDLPAACRLVFLGG